MIKSVITNEVLKKISVIEQNKFSVNAVALPSATPYAKMKRRGTEVAFFVK